MRHQYTCIFSDVLTSRIWAMAPSTRAVWLWFMLKADPEGFVCASTAGVAIGANVTLEAAQLALEELTEVDPDADPVQILEKAPRGWRLVGFKEQAELVAVERQRARNRRYMAAYRAKPSEPANDIRKAYLEGSWASAEDARAVDEMIAITTEPEIVTVAPPDDTSEPLHGSTPPSTLPPAASTGAPRHPSPASRARVRSGSGSDLSRNTTTSISDEREATQAPFGSRVLPSRIVSRIPSTWQPPEELRQEAQMAGVLRFDEQLTSLRAGPVGGARGIFEDDIAGYIRGLFGGWRTWEETQRAKAAAAASKPRGQSYRRPGEEPPELVDFDPRYLDVSHSNYCDRAGLGGVEPLAREWRAIAIQEGKPLTRSEADKAFAKWLGKRARAAKGRAA